MNGVIKIKDCKSKRFLRNDFTLNDVANIGFDKSNAININSFGYFFNIEQNGDKSRFLTSYNKVITYVQDSNNITFLDRSINSDVNTITDFRVVPSGKIHHIRCESEGKWVIFINDGNKVTPVQTQTALSDEPVDMRELEFVITPVDKINYIKSMFNNNKKSSPNPFDEYANKYLNIILILTACIFTMVILLSYNIFKGSKT